MTVSGAMVTPAVAEPSPADTLDVLVVPGDEAAPMASPNKSPGKKKKKKKKKNVFSVEAQDNSTFRLLGSWPAVENSPIDFPPTVPIAAAYPEGKFPEGEITVWNNKSEGSFRMTSEEAREAEKVHEEEYKSLRRAAEAHRQVRRFAQSYIRPGMKMVDICERLEKKTLELISANGLESGWGFPTGCSLNHVAAHYSPNSGDETVLNAGDIMKLDFGVHVGGRIIDSAFTVAFDPKFDPLIQATKDATNAGLRAAGVDVCLGEIGAEIQEVIESFEMEIGGKSVPIKPIANLSGHSIGSYQIHGGKSVPIVRSEVRDRMEEGELYAIETFASTGRGRVVDSGECSHYMKDPDYRSNAPLRVKGAKALLQAIDAHFGTLAFCRRWLDDLGHTRHLLTLKSLIDTGIIVPYPPLSDVPGCFTSQMEHTILLRPTCKEVLSRGSDY